MASTRLKCVAYGSIVTFVVGLGTAIPALGLFFGPLFTGTSGLLGGALAGGLYGRGGWAGMKLGVLVAVVGGLASSIVAIPLGTVFNAAIAASGETGSSSDAWVWVFYAVIGLITGLVFTVVGAVVGGGLAGAITSDGGDGARAGA